MGSELSRPAANPVWTWLGLGLTALLSVGPLVLESRPVALLDDPSAFGVVPTDERGRVQAFIEKPRAEDAPTNLINAGFYVLEPSVLDRIDPGRKVNIERETFPAMVADEGLFARPDGAYWIDVGTPDAGRLHKASKAAPRVVVYSHKDSEQYLRQLAVPRLIKREPDLALTDLFRLDDVPVVGPDARVMLLIGFEGKDHVLGRHWLAVMPARFGAQPVGRRGNVRREAHRLSQQTILGLLGQFHVILLMSRPRCPFPLW